MRYRWLTAFLGVPLTAFLIIVPLYNNIFYTLYLLVVAVILNEEILVPIERTLNQRGYLTFIMRLAPLSIFATWAFMGGILSLETYFLIFAGIGALFFYLAGIYFIFNSHNNPKTMEFFGALSYHYITIFLFMNATFALKFLQPYGAALALVITFVWISDAAGLFAGMLFGRNRLVFLPSNKKTLEGYLGSFVVSVLLGAAFALFLQGFFRLPFQWPLWRWMLFGLCMSLSANFGDLTESYFKRWALQKDSGSFLPGMGGLFDAIDSIIYSAPIGILFFSFPS